MELLNHRGFAIIHKTLSFLAGVGLAGLGYVTLSDQLTFRNNRIHNQLLRNVRNTEYSEDIAPLPESKDYLEMAKFTICSTWNRSVLYMHQVLSGLLHYDRPYDEKVSERIQEYKVKMEKAKETQEVVEPCVVEEKAEEPEATAEVVVVKEEEAK